MNTLLTAEAAKELSDRFNNDENYKIITEIHNLAQKGKYMYSPSYILPPKTIDYLMRMGYRLVERPKLMPEQKETYHIIKWDGIDGIY